MTRRDQLVLAAARMALKVRHSAGVALHEAICVFDLAERQLGVEVWLQDIPSLEAMYVKQVPPMIIVSSLRPPGRRAFNCAHELGHHAFGHGTRVDKYMEEESNPFSPDEFMADCFGGYLLMPKTAVCHGFAKRGWSPTACVPVQVATIASWLGVGYSTLVSHMSATLRLIDRRKSEDLAKVTPKQIRAELAPEQDCPHLVIVDRHWADRPVDCEVGELILVPAEAEPEGACITIAQDARAGRLLRAASPGVGRIVGNAWATYVRVSRAGFTGRGKYRHLEEAKGD